MDAPHCVPSPVTQELAETLVKCKNIMSGFIPIMLCITTALYIIAGWIMFVNALRNFFVEIHLREKDYAGDSTMRLCAWKQSGFACNIGQFSVGSAVLIIVLWLPTRADVG